MELEGHTRTPETGQGQGYTIQVKEWKSDADRNRCWRALLNSRDDEHYGRDFSSATFWLRILRQGM